jgi:uncharacterized protein (DUF433 family)
VSDGLIISDPRILNGKPIVSGTRIPVSLVLRCLASGMSREGVLDAYPTLTNEGFDAALLFAADRFDEGEAVPLPDRS